MDISNGLPNLSFLVCYQHRSKKWKCIMKSNQLHDRFVEIVIEGEAQLGVFR